MRLTPHKTRVGLMIVLLSLAALCLTTLRKPEGAKAQEGRTISQKQPGRQSGRLTGVKAQTPSAPEAIVDLTSGVAAGGSLPAPAPGQGIVDTSQQYRIQVPGGASQLRITLNGNQDVDLVARFGQVVAFEGNQLAFDHASARVNQNNEEIVITANSNPPLRAGSYYILVANYGPGAANFTVTATLTTPSSGTTELSVDDGTFETRTGLNGGGTSHRVNRLTPASYPATLNAIGFFFPSNAGANVGNTLTVEFGTNPDGDADINGISLQTLTAAIPVLDQFFYVNVPGPTIGTGDFVVGMRFTVNPQGVPFALDTTPPYRGRSYRSTNGFSFDPAHTVGAAGNYAIRARVTTPQQCNFSLSPSGFTFSPVGGLGNVAVAASAGGCSWTATSNAGWVTITSGASGSGNGTVNYSVTANSGSSGRIAILTIAGRSHSVLQLGTGAACTLTPIGIGQTINGALSAGDCRSPVFGDSYYADVYSFNGTAGQQIAISMSSSEIDTFLDLIGPNRQLIATNDNSGGGTNSRIPANTGFITLQTSGTYFVVAESGPANQTGSYSLTLSAPAPACTFTLSPTSQSFTASPNIGGVSVFTQSGCAWTATSNDAWITITTAAGGAGNGVIGYSVTANNTGAQRSGTMTVAGHTFTITQSACNFTISPTGQNFGVAAGTGGFSITTLTGCNWAATSNDSWITITSPANGSGLGSLAYNVAANTGPARTGTISVAGQTFTVTQAGQSCSYAISPAGRSVEAAGGNGEVNVTAGNGCNWTATSNAAFITINSGATGAGNGTVGFSVAANTDANSRGGTLTIAGRTFTVTQAGAVVVNRIVRAGQASGAPGGTVSVPIELVAQGDENALGFSITFDPAVLSNPQAALGADAAGASLNTNGSQASQGRFGIAVSLPSGQRFSAGTRQIVNLNFMLAANAGTASTPVGFGDQPVAREISDTAANALAAGYVAGAVAIAQGYEADVAPRPSGNGSLTVTDWVQVGRFVAGTDAPAAGSEFQRADVAPRATSGDGRLTITDWVQAGRYAAGLDAVAAAGGPNSPAAFLAETLPTAMQSGSPQSSARMLRFAQGNFAVGRGSALIVEFDAQGDENALGFSLAFDPAQLRFISAALGDDAPGATLHLNTTQAADGRLGVAMAWPTGQTFAAGTRRILSVTFAALAGDDPATAMVFTDHPTMREVSDSDAKTLPAAYSTDVPGLHGLGIAVLHLKADGTRRFEPLTRPDAIQIDLGPEDERIFLILFGVNIHSFRTKIACRIGGMDVPIFLADEASNQLHLGPIPRSLIGRGEMELDLMVEDRRSKPVKINIH